MRVIRSEQVQELHLLVTASPSSFNDANFTHSLCEECEARLHPDARVNQDK